MKRRSSGTIGTTSMRHTWCFASLYRRHSAQGQLGFAVTVTQKPVAANVLKTARQHMQRRMNSCPSKTGTGSCYWGTRRSAKKALRGEWQGSRPRWKRKPAALVEALSHSGSDLVPMIFRRLELAPRRSSLLIFFLVGRAPWMPVRFARTPQQL